MNNSVLTSLNKIRKIESSDILTEAATGSQIASNVKDAAVAGQVGGAAAAKFGGAAAGKLAGKFLPGVGAVYGAADAYDRYKKGDYVGAALSGIGGAASLVPGIGTAASMGIAGAQLGRDYVAKTGVFAPDEAQPAQAAPTAQAAAPTKGFDPKIQALQKQLIAKGAKITPDGFMGPKTQAAMKQFPDVAMAESKKENKMSESQKIANLRDLLIQLENQPSQLSENVLAKGATAATSVGSTVAKTGKGAWDAVKGMWQAGKTGLSGAPVATGKVLPSGAAQTAGQGSKQFQKALAAAPASQRAAYGAGKAIKANPVKTALGAAGVGAGIGYAATGSSPAAPAATPPVSGKPGAGAGAAPQKAPAAPANAAPDAADVQELNQLAASLENSTDPQDIELMKQYNGIINAINNRAKGDKRTQGEIAASSALQGSGM